MAKKILFQIVITVLFLGLFPVVAEGAQEQGKQLVVLMDRISMKDLTPEHMPNLVKLIQEGSLGLMNTNALGQRIPANTYISIANGQRTGGGVWAGQFYPVQEVVAATPSGGARENIKAGELYRTLTGWSYPRTAVVNPGIGDMVKVNSTLSYDVQVGALGESLQKASIATAVVGNADTKVPRRFAASMIMNQQGQVSEAIIDHRVSLEDKNFPNGMRTDYDAVLTYTKELMKRNQLVVVDLGDVSRLDELYNLIRAPRYYHARGQSLQRMDKLVGEFSSLVDLQRDRLIILAPTPSLLELKNDNLVTPLIALGPGFTKGSLLTSGSTRRDGLVANTDIAPTLLDYFDIPKAEAMVGRPMTSVPAADSLKYLQKVNEQLVNTYRQRPVLLRSTAVLEIIAIIASLLIILFARKKHWFSIFRQVAFVFFLVPLIMLYFRFIQFPQMVLSIISTLLILLISGWFIAKLKIPDAAKLALVAGLTSLSLVLDTLFGANLIMRSPLGYDPMLGSRYYGIGNEFTGVLMGSTLLALASLSQFLQIKSRMGLNIFFGLYLAFVTYVLFAPNLGADAGGVITALVSFGYFIMVLNGKKVTLQRMGIIIGGTLLVLFGGALWDMYFNIGGQSHIGQAMSQLMEGGWEPAWLIIQRKLLMNWKLMQYSIWSRVLVATVVALAFFMIHPKGIFERLKHEHLQIFKGIQAVIVATLTGFLVNDSGVVQAATTAVYLIFPLIYLTLGERLKESMD